MTDGAPTPVSRPLVSAAPADQEFSEAYVEGYKEGLREALREMLHHASRGHTASELRYLIESRIARIAEDAELKRKSLLAPPRRSVWGPVVRAAPTATSPPTETPGSGGSGLSWSPGTSYLFREERPRRGLAFVGEVAGRYPRLAVVSLHPPELPSVDRSHVVLIRPAAPDPGHDEPGGASPGAIAGRIREATEAAGGALVYVDALEFLVTEYSVEGALKFANWLTGQTTRTGSTSVVVVDPRALPEVELRRLQRSFGVLG